MNGVFNREVHRFIVGFLGCAFLINALAFIAVGRFNVGVLVPLFVGIGFTLWAFYAHKWQNWLRDKLIALKLWRLFCAVFIAWLCSLGGFFYFLNKNIEGNKRLNASTQFQNIKAIVVLGSGTPNCQPSAPLVERLKKGQEMSVIHPQAWLVVSGGVDFRNDCSEAKVMAAYLRAQNMSAEKLLIEPKSTSTYENLKLSAKVLLQKNVNLTDSIQIVTSDFHTLRAEKIARKVGYLNPQLIPADTPLFMRYNAWTREYFAYFSGWVFDEY